MSFLDDISQCSGFEWDDGNIKKNWEKHRVTPLECEQAFFNQPLVTIPDEAHSHFENRYFALGNTDKGRYLFIVFTIRENLVRVISARDMTHQERRVYKEL